MNPLSFPRIVHIENTNLCPARCTMCSMDRMTRKTGVMSLSLFETLIRECARYPEVREVHLHGFGEPLVDKNLPQKVALAKKCGIRFTYIVTNAALLTEQMARELIAAGLDGVKFSFYGMTKATYEKVHRHLDFDRTVRNIETFFRVRDQLKALNPLVRFQFCPDLAPKEEFDIFLEKWRPFMDADRQDRFYFTGLHNWAGGKNYAPPRLPDNERRCFWPFGDMQILWDGRVVPCCYDFNGTMVLGDVTRATIAEIWSSERYRQFRAIWDRKKSSSISLCAKCDEPEGLFHSRPIDLPWQPQSKKIIGKKVLLLHRVSLLMQNILRQTKIKYYNMNKKINNGKY